MKKEYEKLKGQNDYREWARNLSYDELSYNIGRFCGPNNKILREKEFGYQLAEALGTLLQEELLSREIDKILTD